MTLRPMSKDRFLEFSESIHDYSGPDLHEIQESIGEAARKIWLGLMEAMAATVSLSEFLSAVPQEGLTYHVRGRVKWVLFRSAEDPERGVVSMTDEDVVADFAAAHELAVECAEFAITGQGVVATIRINRDASRLVTYVRPVANFIEWHTKYAKDLVWQAFEVEPSSDVEPLAKSDESIRLRGLADMWAGRFVTEEQMRLERSGK